MIPQPSITVCAFRDTFQQFRRLRNDPFCVEWDVNLTQFSPFPTHSVTFSITVCVCGYSIRGSLFSSACLSAFQPSMWSASRPSLGSLFPSRGSRLLSGSRSPSRGRRRSRPSRGRRLSLERRPSGVRAPRRGRRLLLSSSLSLSNESSASRFVRATSCPDDVIWSCSLGLLTSALAAPICSPIPAQQTFQQTELRRNVR